jgi:hypothetical protein
LTIPEKSLLLFHADAARQTSPPGSEAISPFFFSMTAGLPEGIRGPIKYGPNKITPPMVGGKRIPLRELEDAAWSMRDRRVLLEIPTGSPRFKINKSIVRIQQLIIEQYGWPPEDEEEPHGDRQHHMA